MAQSLLQALLQQAETLPPDEMLDLASQLMDRAKQRVSATQSRRNWSELAGIVTYPFLGEDAQLWVSRERHEGQVNRDRLLGSDREN